MASLAPSEIKGPQERSTKVSSPRWPAGMIRIRWKKSDLSGVRRAFKRSAVYFKWPDETFRLSTGGGRWAVVVCMYHEHVLRIACTGTHDSKVPSTPSGRGVIDNDCLHRSSV